MAFKIAEGDILSKSAMNRQMTAGGINETVRAGVEGSTGALNAAWNEEYTTFQHVGQGLTGVTTGLMNVGFGVGFGLAMHKGLRSMIGDKIRSFRGQHAAEYIDEAFHWGGLTAARGVNGGAARIIGGPGILARGLLSPEHRAAAAEHIMKNGKKGVFRMGLNGSGKSTSMSGRFIRDSRLMSKWGGIASVAAFVGVPMLASAAFGTAGQLLDEAHLAYQQAKYHTYDTRDFNNRQTYEWNMNKQNAMMTSMMPYENNMMSMARVYHSR